MCFILTDLWLLTSQSNLNFDRSCVKLSYEMAQGIIEGKDWDESVTAEIDGYHSKEQVIEDIKTFAELSKKMRARRFDNGALSIDQIKIGFNLDDFGNPISCRIYIGKTSNKLIEEFMLLANTTVARIISQAFPEEALLRCHPSPHSRKLESFVEDVAILGYTFDTTSAASLHASFEKIEDDNTRQVGYARTHTQSQRPTDSFNSCCFYNR